RELFDQMFGGAMLSSMTIGRGRRRHMFMRFKSSAFAVALGVGAGLSSSSLAQELPFTVTELADFDIPWAIELLPDGRALVSEQRGALKLYTPSTGAIADVRGVPAVAYGGQGGLSDLELHPDFADNGLIYLSYAEAGEG